MRATDRMRWAVAMDVTDGFVAECLMRAPKWEDYRTIVREFEAIEPYRARLRSVLTSGQRITSRDALVFGASMSAWRSLARLAIELPGLDAPDIWAVMDGPLFDLEDAVMEIWLRAEEREMDRSLELRHLLSNIPALVTELDRIDETAAPATRTAVIAPLRADVWDKSGGICWYCGVRMHPLRNFHVDHFLAVADGGTNDLANLVPACQSCNSRKGSRPADYLRRFFADGVFWFEENVG